MVVVRSFWLYATFGAWEQGGILKLQPSQRQAAFLPLEVSAPNLGHHLLITGLVGSSVLSVLTWYKMGMLCKGSRSGAD